MHYIPHVIGGIRASGTLELVFTFDSTLRYCRRERLLGHFKTTGASLARVASLSSSVLCGIVAKGNILMMIVICKDLINKSWKAFDSFP